MRRRSRSCFPTSRPLVEHCGTSFARGLMKHPKFVPQRTGSPRRTSAWPVALAAVVLTTLLAPSLHAQQNGRIVGRVTDSQSGAPISEAQVFVPGTGLGGL